MFRIVLPAVVGSTFAAVAVAGSSSTWLPPTPAVKDQVRFMVCQYRGSALARSAVFSKGNLQTEFGTWTCTTKQTHFALEVRFRLVQGAAPSAGVAVAFDFANWSPKNYVLIPAVVYNGNRFHALPGGYMPEFPSSMYFNPNLPMTISNDPRLSLEPDEASKIELLTGNASTPAMCFFSPVEKRGFILLTEQKTRFGNNGLFIEENAPQNRASFVVSAPGVRKQAAGFGGFSPSGDLAANWKAGDELAMKFRIYRFSADGIPALLEKFMSVRKALTGPNHSRNLVPMSHMADAIVPRFKKRWANNYYLPENSGDFQLGWVSGFMQTPMLALDDPTETDHICRQLDFVVSKLQGKSGYFYGGITANGKLRADRSLGSRHFTLVRKNADALLMFFKFFQILKANGRGDLIKPEWERSAKRLAQAFATTWRQSGEFGQYIDPATGEIAVYNSTGGAIVPAGLALAARYFKDPKFLQVAKVSASFYFDRDVVGRGLTGGHCGDITQDPDSESAFGFLESLMALYWATGDRGWISKARTEANLAATWAISYDETFPPQSDIGKLGCRMAGAVFASAQNKHAAPGICTSSGDYLFKLFRATGELRYAELIRDIQHAHTEAVDMPGHPTCGTGFGASMERIQPTDAEGKGAIGNFIHTQNAWTELDGLMMATELPGLYLQTDTGKLFVFDHVEARLDKRSKDGTMLVISNKTPYDARVAVFAETSTQARKPLGLTAYLKWPRVLVRHGGKLVVLIDRRGKVTPK